MSLGVRSSPPENQTNSARYARSNQIAGVVLTCDQNHETTQAFLRALEFLAPSVSAIESMREHPSFKAFERRWQLPVYFQLRWKEIVNAVEVALSSNQIHAGTSTGTNKSKSDRRRELMNSKIKVSL
jgi:hypothetical protein